MNTSGYTRTTITLPEDLLYGVKKRALSEKKTLKAVVIEGLSNYIGINLPVSKGLSLLSLYGSWEKGERGKSYLKKVRYGKGEKFRENYLNNLWKKSS